MPKYLKVDQSKEIKNRRISARELNQLLQGFWQHRLATAAQPPQLPVCAYVCDCVAQSLYMCACAGSAEKVKGRGSSASLLCQ